MMEPELSESSWSSTLSQSKFMSDHVKKKQKKLDEMDKSIIEMEKREDILKVNLASLSEQCKEREKQLEIFAQKEKEIEKLKEMLKKFEIKLDADEKLLDRYDSQLNEYEEIRKKYEQRCTFLDVSERLFTSVSYLIGEIATVYEDGKSVVKELKEVNKKRKEMDLEVIIDTSSPSPSPESTNEKKQRILEPTYKIQPTRRPSKSLDSSSLADNIIEKTVSGLYALPGKKVLGFAGLYTIFQKQDGVLYTVVYKTTFMKSLNQHFEQTPKQIYTVGPSQEKVLLKRDSTQNRQQTVYFLETLIGGTDQ